MKRIGVSFVWFFNWKYKTIGHLFQDRFRSEKIESDEYLMAAVRYIHQNPVKAGLSRRMEEWRWSSFVAYFGKQYYLPELLDSELILGIFSEHKEIAIRRFKEYNEIQNEDLFIDDTFRNHHLNDDEARVEMIELIGGTEITALKSMPKEQRNVLLRKVMKIEGIIQRQAARILGISPNLIFKL